MIHLDTCTFKWRNKYVLDCGTTHTEVFSPQIFPGVYPHRIYGDTTYRVWSQVSRSNSSLMKRNGTTMKCDGNLTDDANLRKYRTAQLHSIWCAQAQTDGERVTEDKREKENVLKQLFLVCIYTVDIQTRDDSTPTMKLYRLEMSVPDDSSNIYLVTGKGENQDVEVQVSFFHSFLPSIPFTHSSIYSL